MKGKISEHTAGMVVGSLLGIWHAGWALLVASGSAQIILNWIYSVHFLNNPFRVSVFDMTKAVTLVIVTSVVGYIVGWVLAALWNMAIAKKRLR